MILNSRAQLGKIITTLVVAFLLALIIGVYIALAATMYVFSPPSLPSPAKSGIDSSSSLLPILFEPVTVTWADNSKQDLLLLDAIIEAQYRQEKLVQNEKRLQGNSGVPLYAAEIKRIQDEQRGLINPYVSVKNAVASALEKRQFPDKDKAQCFILVHAPGLITDQSAKFEDVDPDFYFIVKNNKVDRMRTYSAGPYLSLSGYNERKALTHLPTFYINAPDLQSSNPIIIQYYFGECLNYAK